MLTPGQFELDILNLPANTTEPELKSFLLQFARIKGIRQINAQEGKAYVCFDNEKWMNNAIELGNGKEFKGRLVTIQRK